MSDPQVSVVMSVYNGARYLRRSVESIMTQEGSDFEFVIVNDGSTDESGEILAEYAAVDKRMRIINQANTGLTKALMRGCAEARGAYIARHDADDISLPGRLALQAKLLNTHGELAFVSCWAEWIGPEDEFLFQVKPEDDPENSTKKILFEKAGPPAHGTIMMRRECYEKAGGYREEFYYAQDSDLWRRLGHIGKIGYVQKILYSYRVTTGSISGSKGAGQTAYDRLAHACHKARLQGGDETEILEKARLLNCTGDFKQYKGGSLTDYFIARCLLANHDGRARKYLWKAIRQNPWHVRAWVSLLRCFA